MKDLDSEKENLAAFLHNQFALESSITAEGLELKTDNVETYSVVRMVTKFIHHKNLSNKYWVSAENNVVKINKFTHEKKAKENKHPVTPSMIKHGW